ncbi:uncharacterized protein LOC141899794 isoform X2 [Tubulanus polymorphus]|uniref:uncharacterized protein LOC141899794 isoform X2 n=1 Tax=Tubulanus polymorphus TaxID=672921 RepID=UPI003DA3CC6D
MKVGVAPEGSSFTGVLFEPVRKVWSTPRTTRKDPLKHRRRCIRSSTLPDEGDYKYYEQQTRTDWAVTDDAGGTVNPAADIHELTSGYYREAHDNSRVEFKEVSHSRDRTGSYVFLALNRNNPLYPTLKAAHLRRKDFDDNATYAFGGVIILLGVVCFIFGCIGIGVKAYFYFVGTGLWCGIILIACGIFAIRASHNIFMGTSNVPLYLCLGLATLATVSALILLILAIIGIVYDYTQTSFATASVASSREGAVFVHIVDIAIGLAGLIAAIILILVAGKYIYRRHHTTLVPRSLIQTQNTTTEINSQRINDMNLNIRPDQSDRLDSTTKFTNPTISVVEQNPLYSSFIEKDSTANGNFMLKKNIGSDYREDDITIGMDIRS